MAKRQFQDVFPDVLVARVSVDPAAFVDDESQEVNVTVPGAAVGDIVLVGPGADITESTYSAHVSAANNVALVLSMVGGDTNNVAASVWTIVVLKVRAF
jgi:hypothetical protein